LVGLNLEVGPHGDQGTIFWLNNLMLYKQGKHPAEAKGQRPLPR
jgi:hypothetical protein